MPFEADLHIHTRYSGDGHCDPRDVVYAAEQAGLFAIAITDHNTSKGAREVVKEARGHDLLVVPGVEVSSFTGHILALGITDPIPKGLSADETVRHILDHGGLPVAAHPGRFYSGLAHHDVRASNFHAVEVANGHSSLRQNNLARLLAKGMDAAMTGGSDAHWPDEIGACRTVFPTAPSTVDDLLDAIRRKETDAVGEGMTRGEVLRLQMRMTGRWVRRRGRRI